MDKNVDLFKGVVNKLQSVINKKETKDSNSNHQRCVSLNRRSSDEYKDQRSPKISTNPPLSLVSSEARNPSYPSSCRNSSTDSRPESSPEAPIASISNDPCSNWSDILNSLDKIPQTPSSTDSSKHTRKKIFKKHTKPKRVDIASSSTPSSETLESRSASDKSPEPNIPLSELHCSITDPANSKSQTQKPKLKSKRRLHQRKFRRSNSLDESPATSNRMSSSNRYRVKKYVPPNATRRISGFEYHQKEKPLKRRNSSVENSQPCKKVRKLHQI